MVNGCLPQNHMTLPCKICNKNGIMAMIMLFNVISVTFRSILNVTILIILIINICNLKMILGIALLAQTQYSF